MANKIKDKYDAIIVGGGHNGLVAAAYLGKAGLDTLVVEKRDLLGGCCVTEEDIFPGYKISATSYVSSLFHPKIIKELDLHENGLEFITRDPPSFTPFLSGDHLFSWQEMGKTVSDISRFSKRDAEAYPRYEATLSRISEFIDPLLLMTPPDHLSNSMGNLWDVLKMSKSARQLDHNDMRVLMQLMSCSASDFLNQWFESEEVKSTLATDGIIGAYAGVETPGTAYVLLHHVMGGVTDTDGEFHRGRWAYVKGGMGGIPDAIVNYTTSNNLNVDYLTGTSINEIVVDDSKVQGVRLDNGNMIEADIVASGVDPNITYLKLIDDDHLHPDFVRNIENYRFRGATTKVNLVLSELPDFNCIQETQRGPQHNGTIHVCEDMEYMETAWEDAKHGRTSQNPILECTIPSVYDNTLVPDGSGHHVMNIFVLYGPKELKDNNWNTEGPKFLSRVIDTLEKYAPNIPGSIVHKQIITPDDLESKYSLTGGCIFHGSMGLDQLFSARPLPGYAQYRGPIKGLYMCGSGTHPGGGVTGIPGHNAAREILKDR
jgi:phytoene dehydrogenase-like protein